MVELRAPVSLLLLFASRFMALQLNRGATEYLRLAVSQRRVTLSSTEAEYVRLAAAVTKEGILCVGCSIFYTAKA